MNEIILYGRLVRDPEVRYLSSGKEVAKFSLAVNREFKNSNGEYEADFFDCLIWGNAAKVFQEYVKKGHRLLLKGRLQTRFYEPKDGDRKKIYEVIVKHFRLVESKQDKQQAAAPEAQDFDSFGSAEPFNETIPF